MIPDVLFAEFRKLSKEDRNEFLRKARLINDQLGFQGIMVGKRVKFTHSKTRAVISGVLVRFKTKYAVVESKQDKYGLPHMTSFSWNVPPSMLVPEA